jgi:hypothetical protein
MSHSPHNARRIQRSAVPDAPLSRRSRLRQELTVGALVGGTMLLIVGIYAATFRYQRVFNQPADFPRWTALTDGIIERAKPIQGQVVKLKDAFTLVAKAKLTQSKAAAIMKKKIADRQAAATETPETP